MARVGSQVTVLTMARGQFGFDMDLKPPQLAEWALDGWKEMLRRHLQTEVEWSGGLV